jgi:dihydrofolate reductase
MRIFIIAAISRDGFIAKDASHNSFIWTSAEDKKRFVELTKRAGTVIVGSGTYETFPRDENGMPKPLKDRLNIVYSRSKIFTGPNVEMTTDEPKILVEKLAKRGLKEVAVIGGGVIYKAFLDSNLADTIYLTVEPVAFGSGIPFFKGNLDDKFDLISEETLGQGSIFKEYKKKQ